MEFNANDIVSWITNNKEWFFSGLGVFIIGLLFVKGSTNKLIQKQKSGDNSENIQVGKIEIHNDSDEKRDKK